MSQMTLSLSAYTAKANNISNAYKCLKRVSVQTQLISVRLKFLFSVLCFLFLLLCGAPHSICVSSLTTAIDRSTCQW